MVGKIAFIFSSNEGQFVGMCGGLLSKSEDGVYVSSAGEFLSNEDNVYIYDLMTGGPQSELDYFVNGQRALFLHGLEQGRRLVRDGFMPDCLAGIGLGEVTALVFAGVFNNHQVITARAEAIQACLEDGSARSVLKKKVVDKIVDEESLYAVLRNASAELFNFLGDVEMDMPRLPVYSGLTGKKYGDFHNHTYKVLISDQISNPILFEKIIANVVDDGVDYIIECGIEPVIKEKLESFLKERGLQDKVKVSFAGELLK